VTPGKAVVVDGANVAYAELSKEGQPKISNIVAVRRALQEKGYDCVIVVDASLRHEIDDPDQLEGLVDQQAVQQAPAGTDADYFVLETAEELDAQVVSNDEFRGYRDRFPWIERRRVPLMLVNGEVELYEPDLQRPHPAGGA
jgi:hypothetical protein